MLLFLIMSSSLNKYLDPSHHPGQTEEINVISYSNLMAQILEEEHDIPEDPELRTFVLNNNNLHSSSISPLKCPTLNDIITITNVGYQSSLKFYSVFQVIQGLYEHKEWAFQKANFNKRSSLIKYHYSDAKSINSLFQSKIYLFMNLLILNLFL